MEYSSWLRVGTIAALFFGSIWVLLPTVFRESAESRFQRSTEQIQGQTHSTAKLDVTLPVTSGDPVAVAAVVKKRLAVAGMTADAVKVRGGKLAIQLRAGGSREDAQRVARIPGVVAYYAPDALGPLPAKGAVPAGAPRATGAVHTLLGAAFQADGDYWSAAAQTFANRPLGPELPALAVTVADGTANGTGGKVSWTAAPPDGVPFLVVSVDGRASAVALPDGTVAAYDGVSDVVPVMVSGPLGGIVGEPEADVGAGAQQAGPAEAAESSLPDWFVRLMPNTAIPLGLDLQGGIDITLQVEVDEAVLGQVSRDMNGLPEAAEKEGLKLDSVRRVHSQPVMEITTAAPLSQLQEFLRKHAGDYAYLESDGTTHRFEMNDMRQQAVRDEAVEQVLDTLRKRIDETGVKDPSIVKKSGGRINIQMPGMDDIQTAVDTIGTTAVLEFRMVDEEYDDALLQQLLDAAKAALPPDQFADDELLNEWLWDNDRLDEKHIVMWEYDEKHPDDREKERLAGRACGPSVPTPCAMPLLAEIVLTGNDINDAGVGWDQNQQAFVHLEFKPRGGQVFCDITGKAVGKRFAVILDSEIMSAPNIRERICGGAARIEMGGAEDPTKDAQTLALVLRTGALDAPVVIASKSQVGATLGADAIREGTIAAVLGSVLVYAFMLLWYKTSGFIADVALTCNVLMVLAALGMFGATLTLPGIAGIALTVGMAVDSNIIVYERIREELRLGVHPRKAVDVGFEKALSAILDANITTAIAGVVLYSYGTGPIKGFAVTLLIGIITTLVTAVFVTRTIMELLTRSSATRLRI